MIVFVVSYAGDDHEGPQLGGVFSTYEKAMARVDATTRDEDYDSDEEREASYDIDEMEVDALVS